MRTVTLLEVQKRNKERVNVYLDGEFVFGLNLMDAAQLRKGQQLSESEIRELTEKDNIVQAVESGVNFLSYRPRSVQEVRQNLSKKKYSSEVIDAAIEKLIAAGYVDDRAFAKFWVENRDTFQPRSKRALQYELRQKGIATDTINNVLDELVNEDQSAYRAAQKRVSRLRGMKHDEFEQKILTYLQRRGFHYEVSRRAIGQLIEELTEEDEGFFAPDVSEFE